jgi:hypothetical protein
MYRFVVNLRLKRCEPEKHQALQSADAIPNKLTRDNSIRAVTNALEATEKSTK